MVQVKKVEVEQAITQAAYKLFKAHGYSGTRMPQIAKAAHISTANIYVYFDSKLDILVSVYRTWFEDRFFEIKRHVLACEDQEEALRQLFMAMWQTLPAADGGFSATLIEALSDRASQEKYSTLLRIPTDNALDRMLAHCLPNYSPESRKAVTNMLIMAFDGYALNYHLPNGQKAHNAEIDALCKIILAAAPATTN